MRRTLEIVASSNLHVSACQLHNLQRPDSLSSKLTKLWSKQENLKGTHREAHLHLETKAKILEASKGTSTHRGTQLRPYSPSLLRSHKVKDKVAQCFSNTERTGFKGSFLFLMKTSWVKRTMRGGVLDWESWFSLSWADMERND